MPHFDGLQPARETGTEQTWQAKTAQRLYKWLHAQGECYSANLQKWAYEFNKLAQTTSSEHISETLEWYITNRAEKALRPVTSARQWCYFYPKFRRAYLDDPRHVQLNKWQTWLNARWQRSGWPAGLEMYLPLIIKRSWENYERFLQAIEGVQQKLEVEGATSVKARRLETMLAYFDRVHFYGVRDFTDFWLARLHDALRRIPRWNGSVEGLIFNLHGERFTRMGEQWASEYCEDGGKWHAMMAYFKGESCGNDE